jgi:hypothetical protein
MEIDEKDDDSEDNEMNNEDEMNQNDVESKSFIFSCVGIGLKNVARIEM